MFFSSSFHLIFDATPLWDEHKMHRCDKNADGRITEEEVKEVEEEEIDDKQEEENEEEIVGKQQQEEDEEKNDPPQVRIPNSYLEKEIFSSQQLARELKMALVTEIESSQSLRNLIEDLKSSHETSKVSASFYAF